MGQGVTSRQPAPHLAERQSPREPHASWSRSPAGAGCWEGHAHRTALVRACTHTLLGAGFGHAISRGRALPRCLNSGSTGAQGSSLLRGPAPPACPHAACRRGGRAPTPFPKATQDRREPRAASCVNRGQSGGEADAVKSTQKGRVSPSQPPPPFTLPAGKP